MKISGPTLGSVSYFILAPTLQKPIIYKSSLLAGFFIVFIPPINKTSFHRYLPIKLCEASLTFHNLLLNSSFIFLFPTKSF